VLWQRKENQKVFIRYSINKVINYSDQGIQIVSGYGSLFRPIQERKCELEDAIKLQQLVRNIDDEKAWI
jgi:hypothetical protein